MIVDSDWSPTLIGNRLAVVAMCLLNLREWIWVSWVKDQNSETVYHIVITLTHISIDTRHHIDESLIHHYGSWSCTSSRHVLNREPWISMRIIAFTARYRTLVRNHATQRQDESISDQCQRCTEPRYLHWLSFINSQIGIDLQALAKSTRAILWLRGRSGSQATNHIYVGICRLFGCRLHREKTLASLPL